jgi:Protein of unknown function (DUF3159)
MNVVVLTQRSVSLFAAVGGWRTVTEAVASKVLFLVAHLVTGQVGTSALVAIGGVAVFAVVRVWTGRKYWQAAAALVMVGVSASLAGSSGHGVDFYLPSVVLAVAAAVVFLVSVVVRWPVIGLVVGAARGERLGWRRDRARRQRYQACTAVFLAKFGLAAAVMVPLYLGGQVAPLGIASTLLGTPTTAACAYLCRRILGRAPALTEESFSGGPRCA